MKCILIISGFQLIVSLLFSQTINITITNIETTEGKILLSFYSNAEQFPYNGYMRKIVPKDNMKNGSIKVNFSGFAPGEYAITLLDDINNNMDMDYRFFIPQEGYGFSNYLHEGLLPPKFKECSFKVNNDTARVKMEVQYW